MPLEMNGRLDRRKKRGTFQKLGFKQKIGLIVIAVVILLDTILPALIRRVRFRINRGYPVMTPGSTTTVLSGGMISVFAIALVVLIVLIALLLAVSRRKKRGFSGRNDDDLMHADHYRRTEREHPHYSADPCAYSERHSWRKSQLYGDPWED